MRYTQALQENVYHFDLKIALHTSYFNLYSVRNFHSQHIHLIVVGYDDGTVNMKW